VDAGQRGFIEGWALERLGRPIEPAVLDRIARFLDLLELWNRRIHLTGERDRARILHRHVADALACAALLPQSGAFLDLGSGAGFPGVVLACVRPDLPAVFLDARQRPVSFLREVIRTIPLRKARALAMRAEDAAADPELSHRHLLVTSRALRLEICLRLAKPLLAAGGRAVSMQTPRTSHASAEAIASRLGYRGVDVIDYELSDGSPRRLIVASQSSS
jgi:16S rRNA (guanine527-N7)-methyltransferase